MIFLSYVSVAALAFLWISENLFIIIFARIVTMVASEIKYLAYSTYVIEVVGPNWRALTGNRLPSVTKTISFQIRISVAGNLRKNLNSFVLCIGMCLMLRNGLKSLSVTLNNDI